MGRQWRINGRYLDYICDLDHSRNYCSDLDGYTTMLMEAKK